MNDKTAIIFTSDRNFLMPTLVAGLQVYRQSIHFGFVEIFVFLVDFDITEQIFLSQIFKGIFNFVALSSAEYSLDSPDDFAITHVPMSALARLSTGRKLGKEFAKIIYLDGDIQITGSIASLIKAKVEPGCLIAATDSVFLCKGEFGRFSASFRTYLSNLGIGDCRNYFNSGVMIASRDTWIERCDVALDFMRRYPKLCRYHDQSALNSTAKNYRRHLHPRYNFQSWYHLIGAHDLISPAIIHFTGGDKPWKERSIYSDFREPYLEFYKNHNELFARMGWAPLREKLGYAVEFIQPPKRPLGWRLPWRRHCRRSRLKTYLQEIEFPFF